MLSKNLYKYESETSVTYSLEKPNHEDYEIFFRLIADEGKLLTKDGLEFFSVIDVESVEGWYEVEYDFESEYENKINIVD